MTTADASHFSQIDEAEYKRRIRAWTMYDWANSAFATTILAAVLPVYFSTVAGATLPSEAAATAIWSMGLSISLIITAFLAPILGTISDVMRGKKKFLSIFIGMGTIATGLLVLVSTGDWILASILFIFARIGFSAANIFYGALLPHVAKPEDQDMVSSRGYAMGYIGGGILLAINIVMIFYVPNFIENAGSRLSLLSVGIWWAVFSIPVLRRVPEPPSGVKLPEGAGVISTSFKQLKETFGDIQKYRELFKYLIAFLVYNDGIGTIIGVATIYGAELGFGTIELILALLMVQFAGIPFSLVFGRLPSKDAKYRPHFLAFVLFNIIMLPVVGVGASFLMPSDITGTPPAPYTDSGLFVGEGVYRIEDGDVLTFEGGWSGQVIPAEALSGEGFVSFVNGVFGEELVDTTYNTSISESDRFNFAFNGQTVELTHSIGPDHGQWQVLMDGKTLLDDDGEAIIIDARNDTVRYGVRDELTADDPGEHILTMINTGGTMTVASAKVLKPARINNLGVIISMVFGLNLAGAGFAVVAGKPLFSKIAETLDTKRSIMLALIVYSVIAVWGFFLNSTVEFWFLAWMVAVVQGGSQALSRSLYVSMSPAAKSGEFFGLYGVMEKFSAIIGPIIFAFSATLLGNSRPAILSLVIFFFVGIYLLNRVDVEEGRRVAQKEDAALLGA